MITIKEFIQKRKHILVLFPKILLVLLAFLLMVVASYLYMSELVNRHLERDSAGVFSQAELQAEHGAIFSEMAVRIGAMGAFFAASLIVILIRIDLQKLRANARVQIMLDSMPLGVSFLDEDFRSIDCNQDIIDMFGLKGKQQYLECRDEYSPQYQPCGSLSSDKRCERLGAALVKGYDRFEWMHHGPDGEPIPCEKTLVRVKGRNGYNLLSYTRDLRELKTALEETREANEYTQLLFDATPLSCTLWDKEFNIINCNQEAVRLFKLSDKRDFKENFLALSPEYQPCGRVSKDMVYEFVEKAFSEGSCRFSWTHLTMEGESLPCEVILVRIKHRGNNIVAAYIRDMREVNSTLEAMYKAENDLRLALTVAEDSTKAKSEFLDNMSHELRTPMNGVLGFLRIALNSGELGPQRHNIIQAETSAKNLLKIIDNVLDFTEIENNKMEMTTTSFRVSDVFSEISENYALITKAAGLSLTLSYPADLPAEMVGDPGKLKQVLCNLIDNAIKFTEKGKISVRARMKSNDGANAEMEFYVKDTGIGMSPEQIKNLFTPFSQANTSSTRQYGGTGMGLALSKHLVTMLGGKIWAESELGEGSAFYFNVRFRLPEASQIVIEPDVNADCAAAEETYEEHFGSGDVQVLLVEDVEINQIIAEDLLTNMGYTVDVANNGQEALNMLKNKDYDVVLMDIQMPVMDGLMATKKIRERLEYRDLPIIALSAHSLPADKDKSLDCGMNDHITKPLDPVILRTTLNKWLAATPA